MDVTPLVRQGQQIIQGYSGGKFRVSGAVYEGAVVVIPSETKLWGVGSSFDELSADDFNVLSEKADEIDVVLLGAGADMRLLADDFRRDLKAKGLNVEVMDTGAACRTYNVLMAEGRRVAAALLPS